MAGAVDRVQLGDSFGALIATGVVCWFGFQIFVNVGMTLGIMPVTGLPLPFLSYGGSSMFAGTLAVGLLPRTPSAVAEGRRPASRWTKAAPVWPSVGDGTHLFG